MSDVMTPAEVGAAFGVDPRTVTRWTKTGKLPYFMTPGGHRRFRRQDVEAMLTQQGGEEG